MKSLTWDMRMNMFTAMRQAHKKHCRTVCPADFVNQIFKEAA